MEWVETTGKTVEAAKEAALDQLGVDEHDAEFEVVEEPRPGLFGRLRGQARVRARVRPTRPRPKVDRRDRRRRGRSEGDAADRGARERGNDGAAGSDAPERRQGNTQPRPRQRQAPVAGGSADGSGGRGASGGRRGRGTQGASARPRDAAGSTKVSEHDGRQGDEMGDQVTVDEQAGMVQTFLGGLLEAFELHGDVSPTRVDEDTVEVRVHGDDLGLLIGPKGSTLQAVQELARTYVQRRAPGGHEGRVRIDIGGYRERRRVALARFTEQVAADVRATGVARALEPMNAADRKVVHDTANALEGVATTSEGEDPYRRVVIQPAAAGDVQPLADVSTPEASAGAGDGATDGD